NTVIVYAGDNGYIWGEHRLYAKHYPYEESIRVPYFIRAPKRFVSNPGRRADQMILNIDLAPTLMDIAGIPIPAEMQGESFLPVMRSKNTPGRDAWIYELFKDFPFGGRVPPHKALRTKQYKYIEWELCRSKPEVYDLKADPREMLNLIDNKPSEAVVSYLKQQMAGLKMKYRIVS
ncbi:DUF4976 domain-containing protein, partial [bacterium]|nr:DUF4976 domain-containing protein [bacterium]